MTGAVFGRYEIKGELGRGGMATVYHAFDPRFRREVAIKVLPREFLHDQTFRARFEREAQSIAALEHPRILPVHDFGEEEERPFIVMRYAPGGSLAERITQAEGGLPLEEVDLFVAQIAEGLDYAHERGIVHRDFKPSNVLLDEKGNAYLADFGIAKVAETTAQLTGSGIVGTPAYMAPEMTRRGGVTPLVDVYALGVTLYQMVTGRLPFEADTPMGTALAHVIAPIPDARVVRPDLPGAVQAVLERGMAKEPEERYASAGELAAALHQALSAAGEVETPPETIPMPLRPAPPTIPVASTPVTPPGDMVQLPTVPEEPVAHVPPLVAERPAPRRGLPAWVWVIGILGVVLVAAVVLVGVLAAAGVIGFGGAARPAEQAAPAEKTAPAEAAPAEEASGSEPFGWTGVTSNDEWVPEIHEFDGIPMALVPGGCFMMGSEGGTSDEQPAHQVCFEEPFWIDVYEVTNAQYGGAAPDCTVQSSDDNQPRVCINWFDAKVFCERRGARLPTEAEWEYAARGPDGLVYPWGNDFIADNVVYDGNSVGRTWEVGSKPGGVSWVGAHDLSGNVYEWVNDWYAYSYPAEGQVNPTGPDSGRNRVLRGGAWNGRIVHATNRNWLDPSVGDNLSGFRCARTH